MDFEGRPSKSSFEGSSTTSYEDNESNVEFPSDRRVSSPPRSHGAPLILRIVLCLVALIITCSVSYTAPTAYTISAAVPNESGDCGLNGTKDCVSHPIGWVCVRPECFDHEIVDEYFPPDSPTFHEYESLVPEKIVFRGDYPEPFTHTSYHLIRCNYIWERLYQEPVGNRAVDSYPTLPHDTNQHKQVAVNEVLHEDVEFTPDMFCVNWIEATWMSCGNCENR
ncbi:hypothetical protein F5X98DRAFT_379463 [Xylaria grammica]|nr:hypothetical protein F5X98DRAFT_379463 [Xylaria grammica]